MFMIMDQGLFLYGIDKLNTIYSQFIQKLKTMCCIYCFKKHTTILIVNPINA